MEMDKEKIIDEWLLAIAEERLAHYDPSKSISHEEIMREFGITQGELDAMDEVEIE